MHNQISVYIDQFLTAYMFGYINSFSSQQALLSFIEQWKNMSSKKGYGGAKIIDLSKDFGIINPGLLITKLHLNYQGVIEINKELFN